MTRRYTVFFMQDGFYDSVVGGYANKSAATKAVHTELESPWHREADYALLYEGSPGEDLEFIGRIE